MARTRELQVGDHFGQVSNSSRLSPKIKRKKGGAGDAAQWEGPGTTKRKSWYQQRKKQKQTYKTSGLFVVPQLSECKKGVATLGKVYKVLAGCSLSKPIKF